MVLDAIMFAKQSYTKMFHSWYGNNEQMRQLALPFLIGRLLEQFLNELQDSKYKRINIFTAHDTTSKNQLLSHGKGMICYISVVPIQLALQLDEEIVSKPPPFCSHFEFEFYENQEQQEFVQIFFNGEPVTIRGAKSTLISREEFLLLTKWVRRSQSQLEAEMNELADPQKYLSIAIGK